MLISVWMMQKEIPIYMDIYLCWSLELVHISRQRVCRPLLSPELILTDCTGLACEDIFARNGSAVRVHELEVIFDGR